MDPHVNLREDTLMMLATVPEVKEKASKVGLYACYDPIKNAIEILSDGKPIAITFNGRTVKLNETKKYYSLDKWLKFYELTKRLLQGFKQGKEFNV